MASWEEEAAEVANYPVINWGAKLTGVLYVKRNNKDSRNAVREMMVDTIKKGYNVLVYPEGTIGLSRQTLPFKVGSFLEATRNNLTVVPVAIEYKSDSDLWRYENFIVQFATQFSKWKSKVKKNYTFIYTMLLKVSSFCQFAPRILPTTKLWRILKDAGLSASARLFINHCILKI